MASCTCSGSTESSLRGSPHSVPQIARRIRDLAHRGISAKISNRREHEHAAADCDTAATSRSTARRCRALTAGYGRCCRAIAGQLWPVETLESAKRPPGGDRSSEGGEAAGTEPLEYLALLSFRA